MKMRYYLILLLSIFMSSCVSMKLKKLDTYYVAIPESSKVIDIPKYGPEHQFNGYPYVYWNYSKQKEKQLDLESPEVSNDSLIFRMWITNPIGRKGQPHGLIEIKYDTLGWKGNLYLMRVDYKVGTLAETITESKKIELTPLKTNWESLVDSLFELKIDILPTDEHIPNYYNESNRYNNDAPTFSFEYATKEKYRFYQYGNVYRDSDNFWQPNNVISLLGLLEDEFNWDSLARQFF